MVEFLWSLHYPQCNSAADRLVKVQGVCCCSSFISDRFYTTAPGDWFKVEVSPGDPWPVAPPTSSSQLYSRRPLTLTLVIKALRLDCGSAELHDTTAWLLMFNSDNKELRNRTGTTYWLICQLNSQLTDVLISLQSKSCFLCSLCHTLCWGKY